MAAVTVRGHKVGRASTRTGSRSGTSTLIFNDIGHDIPRARRHAIADAIAVNAGRAAPLTPSPVW